MWHHRSKEDPFPPPGTGRISHWLPHGVSVRHHLQCANCKSSPASGSHAADPSSKLVEWIISLLNCWAVSCAGRRGNAGWTTYVIGAMLTTADADALKPGSLLCSATSFLCFGVVYLISPSEVNVPTRGRMFWRMDCVTLSVGNIFTVSFWSCRGEKQMAKWNHSTII